MPVYAIKCSHCGSEQDIYRPLKDYDNLPDCCGQKMQRQITAPYVVADIQPYQSMVTGEWIQSRSQHRAHLKQHGKIEVGNEKLPEIKRPEPTGIKEDLNKALAQHGIH